MMEELVKVIPVLWIVLAILPFYRQRDYGGVNWRLGGDEYV